MPFLFFKVKGLGRDVIVYGYFFAVGNSYVGGRLRRIFCPLLLVLGISFFDIFIFFRFHTTSSFLLISIILALANSLRSSVYGTVRRIENLALSISKERYPSSSSSVSLHKLGNFSVKASRRVFKAVLCVRIARLRVFRQNRFRLSFRSFSYS